MVKRQDYGRLLAVGYESTNAPLESENLLLHVYFTFWENVQPMTLIELFEHLIHDGLINSVTSITLIWRNFVNFIFLNMNARKRTLPYNRHYVSEAKKQRMYGLSEAYVVCAHRPSKCFSIGIKKARKWQTCAFFDQQKKVFLNYFKLKHWNANKNTPKID